MKHILLLFSALVLASLPVAAQVQLADQQDGRLFAYPMAPDTCATLESRCNYIISHFWDDYDISKPITDEAAFETTFRDFVDFFRYAHRNVVLGTVRDLVNKAQSNTSNLQKLGEVAERTLYGTEAEYWSDEVYVAFIKPLAANKKLPREVRERYVRQLTQINSVQVGSVLDIEYVGADGVKHSLKELPEAKSYILLFIDDSTDSMVKLLCLSANKYSADWAATASGYGENWIVGCSENLKNNLDLRMLPCCYILDAERIIVDKALSVERLMSAVNPNY